LAALPAPGQQKTQEGLTGPHTAALCGIYAAACDNRAQKASTSLFTAQNFFGTPDFLTKMQFWPFLA